MVCEDCGKDKEDVKERFCPYSLEINDEEIVVIICDDCEYERGRDI